MHQELTIVAAYCHALEAHAARNLLEQNGIHAFLGDENSANLQWSNLIEVKLQVAAEDAERAKELLIARTSNS